MMFEHEGEFKMKIKVFKRATDHLANSKNRMVAKYFSIQKPEMKNVRYGGEGFLTQHQMHHEIQRQKSIGQAPKRRR